MSETAEEIANALLLSAYENGPADVFEGRDDTALASAKAGADQLVAAKLAKYADDGRTQIALTNAGRYWSLNGGYLAFLKEPPAERGGGARERNPELETIRLELMRRRLGTFWWSFGISIASFIFSIVSLVVALTIGGRLWGM